MRRPEIHHSDVSSVSAPVRSVTPSARRASTSRATSHAYRIHNTGPMPGEDQRGRVDAADDLHDQARRSRDSASPSRRSALRMTAIIHGSAAHGISNTEMRAA